MEDRSLDNAHCVMVITAERDDYIGISFREATVNEPRIRVFDPKDDVLVVERRLPHWSQAGTICFITFRSFDSLPKPVIEA